MRGAHGWLADRSQTTVIEYDKPKKNNVHPPMKPVEMLCYLIGNSSKRNAIVLDTFGVNLYPEIFIYFRYDHICNLITHVIFKIGYIFRPNCFNP